VSRLSVSRSETGAYVVDGLTEDLAFVLRELPGLLGADQPEAVRRRLYPDASDDPQVAEEWRRTQHPELFALLADARAVVESDLPSISRGSAFRAGRLEIPETHVTAWISALNAARLALGAIYEVTAADMDPDHLPPETERGLAIVRIDLYGWLQGALIDASSTSA
jgi:hypothetical protein